MFCSSYICACRTIANREKVNSTRCNLEILTPIPTITIFGEGWLLSSSNNTAITALENVRLENTYVNYLCGPDGYFVHQSRKTRSTRESTGQTSLKPNF
jgi:hypothetical protein